MRRVLATLLFVGALAMHAGSAGAASWNLGFKGGVSLFDLSGDAADSLATDSRTGFAGGMFAQADVSPNFAIRLEGLYVQKGSAGEEGDAEVTVKLDYIEFPLLLVGQLPAGDSATLSAFAGPVFGFNMNAEIETEGEFFGVPISGSVDISDEIASVEFSLAFGAGATFDVGSLAIVLDGRYELGLTSAAEDEDVDLKNQGFVFMAGIAFPLGPSR